MAISMGIELVKVFPAKILGGIAFIKAISGRYHTTKFMRSGGVTKDDFNDYLKLPDVYCVDGT
jgi:2-dehydro-3-deoxyphosphogluconate aldolase/(4S)-4-hydroxy-2-oxoglutarate aldolase